MKRRPRPQGDLLSRVGQTVERAGMMRKGGLVIAAVSGGPDSVALLHVLTRLAAQTPLRIHVVHVDHGLRGAASRADARFVERLARSMGWPCSVERLRLKSVSARGARDASPESQWRDARYRVLVRHARRRRATAIAIGHTRDDLAETVLMRMIRGAGAHGLASFGPRSERDGVTIIRPLYDVTRAQVEAYCREQGLEWRLDASNKDRARLRNHVRLDLLPFLEREFNPSIRETLARAAESLRADDECLDALAEAEWKNLKGKARGAPKRIPLGALAALPLALLRRVLRLWIAAVSRSPYPPAFAEVDRLAELVTAKQTGARFELQRKWAFIRERNDIVVRAIRRRPASPSSR